MNTNVCCPFCFGYLVYQSDSDDDFLGGEDDEDADEEDSSDEDEEVMYGVGVGNPYNIGKSYTRCLNKRVI